jgi:RNA polymerase sporulation-specific sigma factor
MYFRSLKKSANDLSLSDSIDQDQDGGGLSLLDVVSVEDDILEDLENSEISLQLRQYVDTILSDREKKIISLRYGLSGSKPLTQLQISKICGISRSYVSRIEKKALEKLKTQIMRDNNV